MPRSELHDVLDCYRAGDLHECARRLRLQLEADPFAFSARRFLAHVLVRLGQIPIARVHYEKLLPLAVGRGDLFGAIGLQRRLDQIESRAAVVQRHAAMHRWFRLLGENNLMPVAPGVPQTFSAFTLLRLPAEVFAQVAGRVQIECFEPGSHSESVPGDVLWHVLWGTGRWRAAGRSGGAAVEGVFDAGHQIGGPGARPRHRMLFSPDTPGERLRMDAQVVGLLASLVASHRIDPLFQSDFVREERPVLPSVRRHASDLDHRVRRPRRAGHEPPRLEVRPDGSATRDRDTGDWLEHGQLELGGPLVPPGASVTGCGGHFDSPRDVVLPPAGGEGAPATEPPGEAEPGATPAPAERRTETRVPVSFTARVALLGLGRPESETLIGDVVDLSMGGVGLRFPRAALQPALTMLQDEALRVDLITLAGGFLQLAGRVRWIDFGVAGEATVSAGVQFALLTDADREAIARLVMDADPGLDTNPPPA